jgi:hypothetical protein
MGRAFSMHRERRNACTVSRKERNRCEVWTLAEGKHRVFQKEHYYFESLYNEFIQRTCTVF